MLVFMVTKDDFDRYGIWKSKHLVFILLNTFGLLNSPVIPHSHFQDKPA